MKNILIRRSQKSSEFKEERFSFKVNADPTFIIPLGGKPGNWYHTYNWIINWGDGIITQEQGSGGNTVGISHTYSSAGIYEISIIPTDIFENDWLSAFGFSDSIAPTGAQSRINRNKLIAITSGELSTQAINPNGSDYLAYTFYYCTSLEDIGEFNIPQTDVIRAASYFCQYTFANCTSLRSINKFSISKNIISITDYFCAFTFNNCGSLSAFLGSITFSNELTSVGTAFFAGMFKDCSDLLAINNIELPQNIKAINNSFCEEMFAGCRKLNILPSKFNLPPMATSIGTNFCYKMFLNCGALVNLPNNFNLPQNITDQKAIEGFCASMFENCSNLTHLPNNFNLPQNITSVRNYFCVATFRKCTALVSLGDVFTLPQDLTSIGLYFCTSMFYDCANLRKLPENFNLPQNLLTVQNTFCGSMFELCYTLQALPTNFKFPQNIKSLANEYCIYMFKNCTNLLINPITIFGSKIYTIGTLVLGETFRGCKLLNEISPETIPQLTVIPSENTYTFQDCTPAEYITKVPNNWK